MKLKINEILFGIIGGALLCEFIYHGIYWGKLFSEMIEALVWNYKGMINDWFWFYLTVVFCVWHCYLFVAFSYMVMKHFSISFKVFKHYTLAFYPILFFLLENIGRKFYSLPWFYYVFLFSLIAVFPYFCKFIKKILNKRYLSECLVVTLLSLCYMLVSYWWYIQGYFNNHYWIEKMSPEAYDMFLYPTIFCFTFYIFCEYFQCKKEFSKFFSKFLSFNVFFFPCILTVVSLFSCIFLRKDMVIVNVGMLFVIGILFFLRKKRCF